jgi:CheY-like chemotaxis protein
MDALYVYAYSALICLIGLFLFLWWWRKTRKATDVYIYVTILLGGEFFEKAILTWMRYLSRFEPTGWDEIHTNIVTSPFWWLVGIPTAISFSLIIGAMFMRIYRTSKAMRGSPESLKPIGVANRNILLVSTFKTTRKFMRELFTAEGIEYHQSKTLMHGFEKLVTEKQISVVLIGLSAIEQSEMKARDILSVIRRENPWCIVVALSRSPNMYELFEARRAFFDDYIYLPARAGLLIATYERWLAKINRWRRINQKDRRRKDGKITDRKCIECREKEKSDRLAKLEQLREKKEQKL